MTEADAINAEGRAIVARLLDTLGPERAIAALVVGLGVFYGLNRGFYQTPERYVAAIAEMLGDVLEGE